MTLKELRKRVRGLARSEKQTADRGRWYETKLKAAGALRAYQTVLRILGEPK